MSVVKKWIKISLLFCFLSFPILSKAQDSLNYASANQLSYDFYMAENWKALLKVGTLAKEQNINFYYLNYRMAVAYQKIGNYRKSAIEFEKLIHQSSDVPDDFLLQSLNKNYLYLNQTSKSLRLNDLYNQGSYIKPNWKSYFNKISVFGGEALIQPYKTQITANPPNPHTMFDIQNNMQCFGLAINGFFNPYLEYNFSYFNFNSSYTTVLIDPFNKKEHNYNITQNQLYFSTNWLYDENKTFSTFFSGIKRFSNPLLLTESNAIPALNVYEVVKSSKFEGVAGFEFKRSFTKFDVKYGALISNLVDSTQIQLSAGLHYYPFGNLNLYSLTDGYAGIVNRKPSISLEQKIGFKVSKWLWLEINASIGQMKNMTHDKGFNVYNVPDEIKLIAGASALLVLNRHLDFQLIYNYFGQETEITSASPLTNNQQIITIHPFSKHIITGGISWKF